MNKSGVRVLAIAAVFTACDAVAGAPRLAVHHDDTLQGLSALLAVRACLTSYRGLVVDVPEVEVPRAVVVELFDSTGNEVGRHAGSKGVCAFARYAVDYLQLDASASVDAGPAQVAP